MFITDPEVLQNWAGFTLCSSAGLAVGECSAVMGLTPCMFCVQVYYVLPLLDYYLLNSTDWVGLCLETSVSVEYTPEGLATTNYQLT